MYQWSVNEQIPGTFQGISKSVVLVLWTNSLHGLLMLKYCCRDGKNVYDS